MKVKIDNSQLVIKNRNKQSGFLNVKDFGAKGNGITDDSESIKKANIAATKTNHTLYFPKGTYLCNKLEATTDWFGDSGTKLVNKQFDKLLTIYKQENLSFKNIIFENILSPDPKSWNLNNHDKFEGDNVVFITQSKHITFDSCGFFNAYNACLKADLCNDIKINHCKVEKARGKFGDGIYFSRSKSIEVLNTSVTNCTRHGIVFENQSENITIKNCLVSDTHHSSKSLGKTNGQLNGGIWIENSGNINIENCRTFDNPDFGVLVSLSKFACDQNNNITIKDCKVIDSKYSYKIASSTICQSDVKVQNCIGDNTFLMSSKNDEDVFNIENCQVNSLPSPNGKNNICYMWESTNQTNTKVMPLIHFKDCRIKHQQYYPENIFTKENNSADFSCYNCGELKVVIENCSVLNTNDYLTLKSRSGPGHFKIIDSKIEPIYLKKNSSLEIHNGKTRGNFMDRMYESNNYKLIIDGQSK